MNPTPEIELSLFEQQSLALESPAEETCYGGAAGGGKLLPLEELLPTPEGWTTVGEAKIGDTIIGADGKPCRIVRLFDIEATPELYRFDFDDGTSITSCADHQWETWDARELAALTRCNPEWKAARKAKRKSRATGKRSERFRESISLRNSKKLYDAKKPSGSVKTTREIIASLKTKTGGTNHAIKNASPLDLPKIKLPIDPYVLGAWLGDGSKGSGQVTGIDDGVFQEIEKAGYHVNRHAKESSRGVHGLAKQLFGIGIKTEKRIPEIYLRASIEQRLSLLQGLMDTDGTVAKNSGSAEFCNTNEAIVDGALELINSLGWKANKREGRAKLYGKDCGKKWTLKFTPDRYVFRLERKIAIQRLTTRRTTGFRYIIGAEPVETQPGRCLEVDSSDHLFLVGKQMLPTHNSHLIRAAMITWALAVPGLQLYLFRRLYPDLVKNHLMGPSSFHILLGSIVLAGKARIVKGEIRFSNGSVIHLRHLQHTKDIYSYQGAEIHVLVLDEATHFSDHEYRYLRGRCRMVGMKVPPDCQWTFPRILLCTNPGGQGHHWVKQGWIDHGPYHVHRAAKTDGGMRRVFIPARMADNPALMLADPDYIDRLEGLGDAMLVRAMKEGDWDVVAGAMFGTIWRKPKHVCDPFTIPVDWDVWTGSDDGFASPAATVWITQNPNNGRHFWIRELYRAGMMPEDFASRMKAIHAGVHRIYQNGAVVPNEGNPSGYMDTSAFKNVGDSTITRGDQMRKLGIKFVAVPKWPGSRAARAQEMHRLLAPLKGARDGLPALQIFSNCTELIRTIPTLMREENNPEMVDKTGEDHLFDAGTYGMQWKKTRVRKCKVKGT